VEDFQPRMLDEIGAMGLLVWLGQAALGPGDGRVALYRRDTVRRLVDPPVPAHDLGALPRTILDRLAARGACFFAEIEASSASLDGSGTPSRDELVEALWDLVWAGLLTNDTFQPLRALGGRRTPRPHKRGRGDLRTAGRWSLVAPLIGAGVSDTERAHARALMLLERHGIVSREAASLEALPGGFSAVYPVLRAMEEAGKVRRGYFVEGIGGAQFAFAGAVDRLRGLRLPKREPQVTVMSAADPANPYGWILPWPEQPADAPRQPKRSAGATLVLVDGEPTLLLDRGSVLLTFAGAQVEALERGFSALRDQLARHSRRALRIDQIDGDAALDSPHLGWLKGLGLTFDHRGLVIERRVH
jgi:ATP-dependent Lhr-like helicase